MLPVARQVHCNSAQLRRCSKLSTIATSESRPAVLPLACIVLSLPVTLGVAELPQKKIVINPSVLARVLASVHDDVRVATPAPVHEQATSMYHPIDEWVDPRARLVLEFISVLVVVIYVPRTMRMWSIVKGLRLDERFQLQEMVTRLTTTEREYYNTSEAIIKSAVTAARVVRCSPLQVKPGKNIIIISTSFAMFAAVTAICGIAVAPAVAGAVALLTTAGGIRTLINKKITAANVVGAFQLLDSCDIKRLALNATAHRADRLKDMSTTDFNWMQRLKMAIQNGRLDFLFAMGCNDIKALAMEDSTLAMTIFEDVLFDTDKDTFVKGSQTLTKDQLLDDQLVTSLGVNWEADTESCSICNKKFTTFKRRHHCRGCGRCVCGAATCAPLSWYATSEERLCCICN